MFSSLEPQKPKVFICFRASNLRNLKSLHVFGPRTSTTSGFYMCWGLGRQQPKVFRYLDIDISSSVSRHRYLDIYLDIGISTSIRASTLIPRHRYLDSCLAHRHRYLDIGISTSVTRHRYPNIDPDLCIDTSTSVSR